MSDSLPLLLRAARGEAVERPPVWMMRQAGRYMKIYRDLRDRYPSFRERSENPDLSYEISMQPFRAFKPDGVILFSDILTPLPGMGIDFDIIESKGPQIGEPIRNINQVNALRPLIPSESMPFVGEVLGRLRESVGNEAAVLGSTGHSLDSHFETEALWHVQRPLEVIVFGPRAVAELATVIVTP